MQHYYFQLLSYKSMFGSVFDEKSQGTMQTTADSIICKTELGTLLVHEYSCIAFQSRS